MNGTTILYYANNKEYTINISDCEYDASDINNLYMYYMISDPEEVIGISMECDDGIKKKFCDIQTWEPHSDTNGEIVPETRIFCDKNNKIQLDTRIPDHMLIMFILFIISTTTFPILINMIINKKIRDMRNRIPG